MILFCPQLSKITLHALTVDKGSLKIQLAMGAKLASNCIQDATPVQRQAKIVTGAMRVSISLLTILVISLLLPADPAQTIALAA